MDEFAAGTKKQLLRCNMDFAEIVKKHTSDDGSIPAGAIAALTKDITTAVGNGFVDKERYKAKLARIEELETAAQTAEDDLATASKWKERYEKLKGEYDDYRHEQDILGARPEKSKAYAELLKATGMKEEVVQMLVRTAEKTGDIDQLEMDGGKIKNAEELSKNIAQEFSFAIPTVTIEGAKPATPTSRSGGQAVDPGELPMEDYIKYRKGE